MTAIGFLHPGEMGISLAASARKSGQQVYWCSAGRSQSTRERAQAQQLLEIPDLDTFCTTCSIIVSVCPPHAAVDQARTIAARNFRGIYADVNAVAPDTVKAIAQLFAGTEVDFVDGGIIGLPARKAGTTWLYLCGTRSQELADCFQAGPLEVTVIEGEIGQASALKMCYAAQNKGSIALLAAVSGMAEFYGVRGLLESQWDIYNPGFSEQTHKRFQSIAPKAWRFTGEMLEIAEAMQQASQPGGFHQAAAELYQKLEGFQHADHPVPAQTLIAALLKDNAERTE